MPKTLLKRHRRILTLLARAILLHLIRKEVTALHGLLVLRRTQREGLITACLDLLNGDEELTFVVGGLLRMVEL